MMFSINLNLVIFEKTNIVVGILSLDRTIFFNFSQKQIIFLGYFLETKLAKMKIESKSKI